MKWTCRVLCVVMGICIAGCSPRALDASPTAGGTHPVMVTGSTFQQEVLESPIPVVVDFWAPWCGPCRAIAPALEALAAEFEGRVKVCKVNVDNDQELASTYAIRSIPALKAFRGGAVVDERIGSAGEDEFREWFNSLLPAPAD